MWPSSAATRAATSAVPSGLLSSMTSTSTSGAAARTRRSSSSMLSASSYVGTLTSTRIGRRGYAPRGRRRCTGRGPRRSAAPGQAGEGREHSEPHRALVLGAPGGGELVAVGQEPVVRLDDHGRVRVARRPLELGAGAGGVEP